MNKGLIFLGFALAAALGILLFPNGPIAAIIGVLLFALTAWVMKLKIKDTETLTFLMNVLLASFIIRTLLASLIYGLGLEGSFGPDAFTYDDWGNVLANYWWGAGPPLGTNLNRIGWGMPYIVASIYFVTGKNPLAIQIISCLLGAATTVLAYFISKEIFNNNRAARYTAIFVGFFPAMIVWTSQLLKEGFIIFFLALSLLAALNLQKRFGYSWIAYLLIALSGLFILRSYIFLMVAVAIVGGFILTSRASAENLVSRFVACVVIAVAFAYMGVWNVSSDQIEAYGNLDRIQVSRKWASTAANSGVVNEETDVSTSGGAISALPLGLLNLLLAPFPWQVGSLTQGLTMPEMILWWGSLPFLISGLFYTIKTRFRESISILFFTLILSLTYAIYQGNLGTIYRQRSQIQVFLLLFTAVGFALRSEKKEQVSHALKTHQRMARMPIR
ncbi:MAG: glycosyltransferase family 39 protein [Acidobacteriota bacterium]